MASEMALSSEEATLNKTVAVQLAKTKICAMFLKGSCTAAVCRFAHSQTELRTQPDLTKTAMCRAYQQGKCNDRTCKFAHGESELRCNLNIYKTQICHFFERGHCKKGNRCRHAHGAFELRSFEGRGAAPAPASASAAPPAPPSPVASGGIGSGSTRRGTRAGAASKAHAAPASPLMPAMPILHAAPSTVPAPSMPRGEPMKVALPSRPGFLYSRDDGALSNPPGLGRDMGMAAAVAAAAAMHHSEQARAAFAYAQQFAAVARGDPRFAQALAAASPYGDSSLNVASFLSMFGAAPAAVAHAGWAAKQGGLSASPASPASPTLGTVPVAGQPARFLEPYGMFSGSGSTNSGSSSALDGMRSGSSSEGSRTPSPRRPWQNNPGYANVEAAVAQWTSPSNV